jgi:hypothetical protein
MRDALDKLHEAGFEAGFMHAKELPIEPAHGIPQRTGVFVCRKPEE